MKRIIIIIFSILYSLSIYASANDSLHRANELYKSEKYQEAIKSYQAVIAMGKESAELHYNLGNSYFKSGDVPNAILHFERANVLQPNDEDILFNLELANQYIVDKIEPLPEVFFMKWWKRLIVSKSTDTWAYASLIAFLVFLILGAIYNFSKSIFGKRFSFFI